MDCNRNLNDRFSGLYFKLSNYPKLDMSCHARHHAGNHVGVSKYLLTLDDLHYAWANPEAVEGRDST